MVGKGLNYCNMHRHYGRGSNSLSLDLVDKLTTYRGFQEGWRLSDVTSWSAVNHDNYQYSTSTQQHQCNYWSWLTALQLVTSGLASTFLRTSVHGFSGRLKLASELKCSQPWPLITLMHAAVYMFWISGHGWLNFNLQLHPQPSTFLKTSVGRQV